VRFGVWWVMDADPAYLAQASSKVRGTDYRSCRRPWGHEGAGIGAVLVLLAVFSAEIAAVVLLAR
jgi:hypothetical protein